MGKTIDAKVPDIGNYKDVPVIEVLVKNGERIEKDQPLLVLETDKATMEVPSPAAGVVSGLTLKAGAKLSEGDVICQLETGDAAAPSADVPKPPKSAKPQAALPLDPPAASAAAPSLAPSRASTPAQASPASGSAVEVRIPDIGNYKGVPVIEVLVKDGDVVAKEAPLLVLESDKSTLEVPAPEAGTVRTLKLKVGDKVSQGDAVCIIEGQGSAAVAAPPSAPVKSSAPAPKLTEGAAAKPLAPASNELAYAGPATRKFARELGVDLSKVKASGPRGRIVIEDVQAYVKLALTSGAPTAAAPVTSGAGIPPIPAQDFSQFGAIETKALARIRKLSAAHLHRAWLNIPHVTQFDDADITELEDFRKTSSEESGTKLTLLPFIMKAVAVALKTYPEFNSSLAPDGENLILKKYCHLGFAADTPNGLVVPVVRDVWNKGIVQLANECGELAKKARDGKLKPDEMKGGCFSISSLGGLGVTGGFTPIVNAPEVAILGVSRATMKPVWDGKTFLPRLLLPLSLSYDHRVIDGAYAARFMVQLTKSFADLRRLML